MLTGIVDGVAPNWKGEEPVELVVPDPKANDDDVEPKVGIEVLPVSVDNDVAGVAEKAKPLLDPVDTGVLDNGLMPPKLNTPDVLEEPNPENAVVGCAAAPKLPVEPKTGAGGLALEEITGGANGRGGLLAPKANGVLVVVVVAVRLVGAAGV